MDETKKLGGLRFTEITADHRKQIAQWLTQTRESSALTAKSAAPSCALAEETESRIRPPSGNLDPQSPSLCDATRTGSDCAALLARRPPGIQETALFSAPFSKKREIAILWPRPLSALAAVFLFLIFLGMPIFLLRNFRYEIGDSLIRVGERLKGNSNTQTDAISITSQGSTPPVPNPISQTPAKEDSDQQHSAASNQANPGAASPTGSCLVDCQNSRQHFADAHSSRGRSANARQLWSKIGSGDSSAEVALAQLYLTGEGVPRNCEQARVLLKAASKSGNSEAQQRLHKLEKDPCH